MDVQKQTTEKLTQILELYIQEQEQTSTTMLNAQGKLYCPESFISPFTHSEADDAYDELLNRNADEHHQLLETFLQKRNRHDFHLGILCTRMVQHITNLKGGELPDEYLKAME